MGTTTMTRTPVANQVFDVIPSTRNAPGVRVVSSDDELSDVDAIATPVTTDGDVPAELRCDRQALTRSGFTGSVGQALAMPMNGGAAVVAVGIGPSGSLDSAAPRRAPAAFARAVPDDGSLATSLPTLPAVTHAEAAAAVVEGVLLARYRFDMRSKRRGPVPVQELVLVAPPGAESEVRTGAERGLTVAAAAVL